MREERYCIGNEQDIRTGQKNGNRVKKLYSVGLFVYILTIVSSLGSLVEICQPLIGRMFFC